jgi:hypothetical protein
MPDSKARKDVGGRREGRRSLAAYEGHARGLQVFFGADRALLLDGGRGLARRVETGPHSGTVPRTGERPAFSAGIALALVFPLVSRLQRRRFSNETRNEGAGMKRKPSIKSLDTVSVEEANAYLEHSAGDELNAAYAIALERARLDGSRSLPDDAEVHQALFLLCRALGKRAPSFDEMRVELRRRLAA